MTAQSIDRMYHLIAINDRTGRRERLSVEPVTHAEGCTWMSKHNLHKDVRLVLEEAAPDSYLAAFVAQYLQTAVRADSEEGAEDSELATSTKAKARMDCMAFLATGAYRRLAAAGVDASQAGHDFWLTRNGHGTGYWDRGLGDAGDQLTAIAKCFESKALYVGDDGLVHIE